MTARGAVAAVWAAMTLAVAGCASRPASSPFVIRSGHGPVKVGHLPAQPAEASDSTERAMRQAVAQRAARNPESLPSIERVDRGLRDALTALGAHETAEAHVAVAVNYWRVGIFDAAYDHYSDALKLAPKNVAAWDGRARVWRHWGMIEPALTDVHRAIFYGPKNPEPRNTLGTILEMAGMCFEAREAYSTAVALDSSAGWARANLDRLTCK